MKIDCRVVPEIINPETFDQIKLFAPFGIGNPEPVFLLENLLIENVRTVGKESKHLKLTLSGFNAIAFGMGELSPNLKPFQKVDVIFNLIQDSFNGISKLTLRIKDIKNHV
jgi:single-stranded-DNA-specific exonuclease